MLPEFSRMFRVTVRGCLYGRRDGTFTGTGRLTGRDVYRDGTFTGTGRLPGRDAKRDLAMHVYISYLSQFRLFCRRFSSRPGKSARIFIMQTLCPALPGRYYAEIANFPV